MAEQEKSVERDEKEQKNRKRTPVWRVLVFGSIYLVAAGAAFLDVRKRDQKELNGKKAFWMLASFSSISRQGFVLPAGALAYFIFGRKK